MKKIAIYAIGAMAAAGLFSRPALHAQDRHEFSAYGGEGLSTLTYSTGAGERKNGSGGQIGLGYRFFFSPDWSLGTGAEIVQYKSVFHLTGAEARYMTADIDGDAFEFHSTVSSYEEKQKALLLQIPLMPQFQTGGKHRFYAAAGGKIGIPLSGKYENTSASIRNSGFYAEENYEYTTQEFMGFGTFPDRHNDGDLKFKAVFFASAEAGMRWKLKDGLSLYTGAYLDYGLNSMHRDSKPAQPFVAYNSKSPRDFSVNSVLNSQYAQAGVSQAFADKITPVSAGIKVSLAFAMGDRGKEKAAYTPPVTDPAAAKPAKPRPVVKTQPADAPEIEFCFIIHDDWVFLQGNEDETGRLYAFTDKYRSEITSGKMPVYVDSYCASSDDRDENLQTASFLANRIKSQLILKKKLKGENFVIRTHATSYKGEKGAVVVSFSLSTGL